MARNVYGLDLGTYDIKIFDKKKDRIWHAKNVIAMKDKKYIFSIIEHHISRNKLVLKNITRNFSPLILPYNAHLPHPVFPL